MTSTADYGMTNSNHEMTGHWHDKQECMSKAEDKKKEYNYRISRRIRRTYNLRSNILLRN